MELVYQLLLIACAVMGIVVLKTDCRSRYWLGCFLLFLCAYLGLIVLDAQDYYISPALYFLFLSMLFLPGPLLLGYISHISTRANVSGKDFLFCLLPGAVLLTSHQLLTPDSLWQYASAEDYRREEYIALFNFLSIMAAIHMLTYLGNAYHLVWIMRQDWATYQSKTLPRSWHRMVNILAVMTLGSLLQMLSAYLNPAGNSVSIGDVSFVLVVMYFIWLAVLTAYEQRQHQPVAELIVQPVTETELSLTLQEKPEEENTEHRELADRIQHTLNNQELYLQDDLSLASLSAELYSSTHKVSAAINQVFECSFYELINRYRAEYAARQLRDNSERSVTDVMFDSGFTSKSTFYSHFKKCHHCTPSEYRQRYANDS